MARVDEVAQIFEDWGVRAQVVPASGDHPVVLNVFAAWTDRYPVASVLAPKGEDGWLWGDNYEWSVRADVEPAVVATTIRRTLSLVKREQPTDQPAS